MKATELKSTDDIEPIFRKHLMSDPIVRSVWNSGEYHNLTTEQRLKWIVSVFCEIRNEETQRIYDKLMQPAEAGTTNTTREREDMIGKKLTQYQVAVLQSVANCVGSVGQLTRKTTVTEWLTDEEDEDASGIDAALDHLEKECLVEKKMYKGIIHYALTDDGYRCNRIDVSGIQPLQTAKLSCQVKGTIMTLPQAGSSGEDFETGEIVQVSNCTFVGGSTDDDVVVKFDSSPFEYCLPGSVIRHIPPAQAEPVEAKEPWKPEHMEEVWVRAKATSVVDGMVELDFEGADDYIIVPLAQLRPLPVVQGGD